MFIHEYIPLNLEKSYIYKIPFIIYRSTVLFYAFAFLSPD